MNKRTLMMVWLGLLCWLPLLQGGSCIENLTRDKMVDMLVKPAFNTFLQEDDLGVAWQSIGGQLKLIEILLSKDQSPARRDHFQMLLCQGFASYALLMEPGLARLKLAAQNAKTMDEKKVIDAQAERLQTRMRRLALRGRDHCFEILERKQKGFSDAAKLGKPLYTEWLQKNAKVSDVPTLFWAGFGWGYALINGLEDTNLTAQIPQIKKLMQRIVDLDAAYFFGGGHIFLATLFSQSKMLGGDLKKAKENFDKAYEKSDKSALIVHYYQAKFYMQQTNNTAGCKKLLKEVTTVKIKNKPQLNLMNAWSRAMARVALMGADDFCP